MSALPPPPPPLSGGGFAPPPPPPLSTGGESTNGTTTTNGSPPSVTNGVEAPAATSTTTTAATELDARQIALLQLCFDETEITSASEEEWDATNFVRDKCAHVSLATLCQDLTTYAEDVDHQLMQHIHDEVHEAFIAVSGQLVSMQDSLKSVMTPLEDLKHRVSHASEGLSDRFGEIGALVDDIKKDELERIYNCRLLELVLSQHSLTEHIRAIQADLAVVDPKEVTVAGDTVSTTSGAAGGAVKDSNATKYTELLSRLARAASDVLQVTHTASMLYAPQEEHAAEVADTKAGATTIVKEYYALLDTVFVSVFNTFLSEPCTASTTALSSVLGVYRQLTDEKRWCEVFSKRVVLPLCEQVISWRAANAARNNATQARQLIEKLAATLRSDVLSAIPLIRRALLGEEPHSAAGASSPSSSSAGGSADGAVSIVIDAVWPAVADTVAKRLNFLFVCGLPATLHANFNAAQELVALMEEHCSTIAELFKMRSAPSTNLWILKWNLDVYHALQQAELHNRLNEAFKNSLAESKRGSGGPVSYCYEASAAVADALKWYLDPSVMLFPLLTKFVRDSFTAVAQLINAFVEAATSPKHSSEVVATLCSRATKDLSVLREHFFPFVWGPLVTSALDNDDSLSSTVSNILQSASALCERGQTKLGEVLQHNLVEAAAVLLEGLKGIKKQYHLKGSSRPIPTEPEGYMSSVLDSIVAYREYATQHNLMTPEQLKQMTEKCVDDVTQRLHALTSERLIEFKKAQAQTDRRRVKKDAASTASETPTRPTDESATDRDKMIVLLYLNVEEYANRLRKVGINKERYAPVEAVFKLLLRAKWILGADIPMPPEVELGEGTTAASTVAGSGGGAAAES